MTSTPTENIQIIPPTIEHSHTIILLHGRDSKATEFSAELFESEALNGYTLPQALPSYKWIFPSAKPRYSKRFDCDLTQWFDIWSLEEPTQHEELQVDGLAENAAWLLRIISNELAVVPPERIVLGGISQGCVTAIHTLLLHSLSLGGFVGLCGWSPSWNNIAKYSAAPSLSEYDSQRPLTISYSHTSKSLSRPSTPVYLGHCRDDTVISIRLGQELSAALKKEGLIVQWKEYEEGGHWVNEPGGIDDILSFLQECHSSACHRVLQL